MSIHPFHVVEVKKLHLERLHSVAVILVPCIDWALLEFLYVIVDIPPKLPYESFTVQTTYLTNVFVSFGNVNSNITCTGSDVKLVHTLIRTKSSSLFTQTMNIQAAPAT